MTREELAAKCDQNITRAAEVIAKASLVIGWYGSVLKENNLFHELGYEGEEEYFRARGIGRSTWFRAVEIAQAFRSAGVEREKVLSMKIESARMLAKCPVEVRANPANVEAAITEHCRDFEIRMKGEAPRANLGVLKIRRLALIVEMSDRERKQVNEVIEEWMSRHHVPDRGKALAEIVQFASEMMKSKRCA